MTGELKRELGLFTCIMLVAGNIIGIGIFLTPGGIAAHLPTAGWVLVAWAIGGFLAMAGALTYGELGAAYPYAGGNYVFLRAAYGPLVAFLYGWAFVLVTSTGTIALLAIGFAEQLGFPKDSRWIEIFALSAVLVLSYLNYLGVKFGAGVTNAITLAKIVAMAALIGLGATIGTGHPEHFQNALPAPTAGVWTGIGSALVPMAFAYSGWNATVFMSEEVKNPSRNIPMSLALGTLLTAAIYVAMNFIYLYAVPLADMPEQSSVAESTAATLFGPAAGRAIAFLVAFSALGCLSASILTNPRTLFAMSRDRLFFDFGETVHPTYGTPTGAILFSGAWSCGLILLFGANFEDILTFLSVPLVVFLCLTVAAIFVLRVKHPDLPRPYRCWGYPWIPGLYVIISIWMLVSRIQTRWDEKVLIPLGVADLETNKVIVGLIVCLIGIPVYYVWRKLHTRQALGS
ncbi:amino acid permease [bacterium]|nr:amino acid permease [bacterium]